MSTKNLILIIDDDSRNIFALTTVLKAKKYNCLAVNNVHDALSLLKENKNIGIVLLDMMMPEIDGYEAIGLIKAIPALTHLPLIAVTAQAMMGDKQKCLDAGATDYVSKPIDIDLLIEIIQKHNSSL